MARKGAFQKGICPNPAGRGAGLSGEGKSLRGQLKDEVVRATALLLLPPAEFARKVKDSKSSTLIQLLGAAVQGFAQSPLDKRTNWEVIESFMNRSIGKPALVKADDNDENKTTFTLNYNFEKKELEDEPEDESENKSESRTAESGTTKENGDQESI